MHHIGTITKSSKFPTQQFHGQCSCGTAGHFATRDEAATYLTGHFAKQGGMSTTELVDKSDELEVEPGLPTPHVAGVGTMPASHATQSPSEWTASEQPQTVEQLEHDGPATEVTESFPAAASQEETSWKKKKK